MKTLLTVILWLIGIVGVIIVAHLALIEVGREVATLRTTDADGGHPKETRLWIVDVDGAAWLHSEGPGWVRRFEANPVVEVIRQGRTGTYLATPVPGPHPDIDAALRRKYGIADRWVRLIAPCGPDTIPVRLDPVPGTQEADDAATTGDL